MSDDKTNVSDGAYKERHDLTHFEVPEGTRTIGAQAFEDCDNLIRLTLPKKSLNVIGACALKSCVSLQEIEIPDSVVKIGHSAFGHNYALSRVKLPKNLKRIEGQTFFQCASLKSICIPASVKYIGSMAFVLSSLKEITFLGHKPVWKGISSNAFSIGKSPCLLSNIHLPAFGVHETIPKNVADPTAFIKKTIRRCVRQRSVRRKALAHALRHVAVSEESTKSPRLPCCMYRAKAEL